MELVFVAAKQQNYFFIEFVELVRQELADLGIASHLHFGVFPPLEEGRVFVLVPPHEYFRLSQGVPPPRADALARTIFISMEQPRSHFFRDDLAWAPSAGAVFDISAAAVRRYRRRGIPAEHLQLGYSEHLEPASMLQTRSTDVLFMGSASERRARLVARAALQLQDREFSIVLSDNSRPNPVPLQNFVTGSNKRQLLSAATILLNIHQGREPYFEWLRILDAVHTKTAVLTEPSRGYEPLVPGIHFHVAPADELGRAAQELLQDIPALRAMSDAAYDFLKCEVPLRRSIESVAAVAEALAAGHPLIDANRQGRRTFFKLPASPLRTAARRAIGSAVASWIRFEAELAPAKRDLKHIRLELLDIRRQMASEALRFGDAAPERVHSSNFCVRRPRVTVVIPLFKQGRECIAALESVRLSTFDDFEIVVVEDASPDDSHERALNWLSGRQEVCWTLVHNRVNAGLPRSRNEGLELARGEYVLFVDADNMLFHRGLSKLVQALDKSASAWFSYGMLATFPRQIGAKPLLSEWPWDPMRLRRNNYIDAMALFRRDAITKLGGYTTDPRLHGWEDYDLYCRIAESGGSGAFVQAVVGAYRVSRHSMASLSNLSWAEMFEALRERAPRTMADARPDVVPGAERLERLARELADSLRF